MSTTSYAHGELDREIVLTRVINAPRERVFRAWSEPERMFQWFGPEGFRCELLQVSGLKVGAVWRFTMIAPNGQRYGNRMTFLDVLPSERLVFDHGSDQADDSHRFRVTLSFDSQSDGKTVLTLRQLHPSKAQRDNTIGFGAVELGFQTLAKLEKYLHEH